MAEADTTHPTTPAPQGVEKGAQLGKYLVAAGALKQEQVQDILDIQQIVKTHGVNTGLAPDRAETLGKTYGAVINESIAAGKPRTIGDIAVATGMVQSNLGIDNEKANAVVENLAALQANHRMEMIASVMSENGVDKTALVKMRDRGIFPMDINNLPQEHWIDDAPEHSKRMQSQAGMTKLLAGNLIQGTPDIAKSPDVQHAIVAARKLAYNNNQEIAGKFNELGLPNLAGMVTSGQDQGVALGSIVATTPADDNKSLNAALTAGVVESSNKVQLELMKSVNRMNHNVSEWTIDRASKAGLDDASLKAVSDGQISAARAMIEVATAQSRAQMEHDAGMGVGDVSFTARFGGGRGGASRGGPAV